jgi:hypothetical protein
MLPDYIPQHLAAQLEQGGFDLESFSNQIIIIGLITATLTLIIGFVNPATFLSLAVKMLQSGLSLIFIILFLGAGNITNLGYTTFDITMEGVQNTIVMDLRFFVYFSLGTILLRMVQIYLEWSEARIETAPAGRIAP